jgi:hypothetical protein
LAVYDGCTDHRTTITLVTPKVAPPRKRFRFLPFTPTLGRDRNGKRHRRRWPDSAVSMGPSTRLSPVCDAQLPIDV